MIVDLIELSSGDEEEEEHVVCGQGHSVQVIHEIIDLITEDLCEAPDDVHGHGDAARNTISWTQEFNAKDGQDEVSQCKQECVPANGQGGAAYSAITPRTIGSIANDERIAADCTSPPQRLMSIADYGQSNPVDCTPPPQRLESIGAYGHGNADHCTTPAPQRLESIAGNGEGNTSHCTATSVRQGSPADGQSATAHCTATPQRVESVSDDGQGDIAHCITTMQRLETLAAHGQGDIAYYTSPQGLESPAAHRQGSATQCRNTSHNQNILAAVDSIQESTQSGIAAETSTSLSRAQQKRHRTTSLLDLPPGPTALPFPRQFWKAGEYRLAGGVAIDGGHNRLRVHPKFLHSNATSHKWAFGAIAELLDNAVDEIHNGATFVKIDKMKHTPDGEYSLMIQDDGGGMSPESLRCCMSFGFSHKCSTSSIGQYGNGFKTSTMRLGADVIVFTCKQDRDNRILTQSVGLLSYTFLMKTRCTDILVPAVDYEFDAPSSTFTRIMNCGEKHFSSNLSALLKWSPFSTEEELLNQFRDMEFHGTKIIVFNLWFKDEREMELDFISDEEDIMISGAKLAGDTGQWVKQMHVANCFRYSLRVYSSILYLHVPKSFRIILCGQVVEPHHIAKDLIFPQCIRYRPQVNEILEVDVAIGFLKGAPKLDIYGFNVYHKNRLIMPFWPAGSYKSQRRGIAGVLETNFIRPTHDKQDFEKTDLFHRLETRLKDMATEYWRHYCHLVGYTPRVPLSHYASSAAGNNDDNLASQATNILEPGLCKRRNSLSAIYLRAQKRRKNYASQPGNDYIVEVAEEESRVIVDQNTRLKAECSELEAMAQQLARKVDSLREELCRWKGTCEAILMS